MRTSEELYHQVRWDPRFDPARFVLGLLQRGAGPKRVALPSFVPGGDIPWHRVLFIEADGELVWDRATGVDRVESSGAGRARAPRLLRAPFFTARTPHVWDPARGWVPAEDGVRPAPAPASGRVRLLTWNTLWDRYDGPLIETARRRPLLLAELAAADADVIALQEVERPLLEQLMAQPWVRASYTLGTEPGGRDVADSGLLLLSRIPVREAGVHFLAPHKAVTAVTVDTVAGPLVVAATHLSSDHSENGAGRRRTELASLARGLAGVDGDVVLLGDFNDARGGAEGPAAVLGLRDAWADVHGEADATPTFDPAVNPLAAVGSRTGLGARLDRILLRGGARVAGAGLLGDRPATADGLFVSDHFGVAAELDLHAGPPADPLDPLDVHGVLDVRGVLDVLDVPATARTAVAWLPPRELWPAVQDSRRELDPGVDRWPPHVNLLFGFVPESSFERAAELLAVAAAELPAFTARLGGVHGFGHREEAAVWLDPAADGEEPWQELRAALTRRFPSCRGRAGGSTPHLTLGRATNPEAATASCTDRLARTPGIATPIRVGQLTVLSRRGDEPMRPRFTVDLGTGRVRWLPETGAAGAAAGTVQAAPAADGGAGGTETVVAGPDPRSEHAGAGACDGPDAPSSSDDLGGAVAAVVRRLVLALPEGVVEVVGSRRIGGALAGADLDLVVALPGRVDPTWLRARVLGALPEAEGLREVRGARVPGLRLRVGALRVDLAAVGTGSVAPVEALAHGAGLDEAAAIALSAVSDARALRAAVDPAHHPAFAELARRVKAWARARGLDSAPFGGLPGLAWTLLAARTTARGAGAAALAASAGPPAVSASAGPVGPATFVRPAGPVGPATFVRPAGPVGPATFVRPAGPVGPAPFVGAAAPAAPTPDALLREFFGSWAAWDWRQPVRLGGDGAQGPAEGSAQAPLTVLTPSAPVRTCTAQVGPGFRDLLVRELYRAWEITGSGPGPWPALYEAPPLHRRHAAWAVVDVRASGSPEFEETLGRVRGRMRALLTALEEAGAADAHAWPRPVASGPCSTRYAIGLGAAPLDAARLAAVAAPWTAGLGGVAVEWAVGGDVPTPDK
ncbi:RNA repair domain-containing protein [Streptomyces sp. G-G2]|uniref:RNA repair domain-containing protein n=1 Tax=Streptomyces sp. G-G2 TaxID=3046201 RepID=UPI0024BB8E63|nr:RNA repair domain-containing protein [Streptomyces sp. G-G2]MDJ0383097.1 RNA repair domain-containing protein [Streptomyces sp. G-G2]